MVKNTAAAASSLERAVDSVRTLYPPDELPKLRFLYMVRSSSWLSIYPSDPGLG